MATRRRGGADLDDLKAKLGVGPSPSNPTPEPSDVDQPDDDVFDAAPLPEPSSIPSAASVAPSAAAFAQGAAPPSAIPASAMPASPSPANDAPKAGGPVASADAAYGEDYSESVSVLETAADVVIDPNAYDPELAAPGTKSLTGIIVIAIMSMLLGLAFGLFGMGAKQANDLQNAITTEALAATAATEPIAQRIVALHQAIADLDTEQLNPDFDAQLRAAMAGGDIALAPSTLARFNTLIGYHERVGTSMVDYSVATALLSRQIQEHLALTDIESDEIERLMAGRSDDANYGIAVELQRMIANYQNYAEDPEANTYVPMAAERVAYDSLEMTVEGEGDERVETFAVRNSAGETMNVLVHDLVLLDRDQLLPPAGRHNAIDRYRQRAARIKETAEAIVGQNQSLLSALESAALPPTR